MKIILRVFWERLRILNCEDWENIFLTLGVILMIFAKPLSYFSELKSLYLWLAGFGFVIVSASIYSYRVNRERL